MKVIKPLSIDSTKLVYSNSIDIVPVWSESTTYAQSSEYTRVVVSQDSNYYESLVPNNLNNSPFYDTSEVYWKNIGTVSDYTFASTIWDDAITYNLNDIVLYSDNNYYQSIRAGNLNKEPTLNLTGNSPYWVLIGPTNSKAQFDTQASTQTIAGSILVSTVASPKIDSVALFNLEADSVYVTSKSSYNAENSNSWYENTSILDSFQSKELNCAYFSPEENMLLVGVATAPYILYSLDFGQTWQAGSFTTTEGTPSNTLPNVKSITYSKKLNKFIAVGSSTVAFPYAAIYTSSNGKDWVLRYFQTSTITNITSCVYIEGSINKFVCTCNNGRVVYSTDGNTWTLVAAAAVGTVLYDSTYNYTTGEFFAVGSNGVIVKSTNLQSWTSISSGVTSVLNSIVHNGTDYVIVGASSTVLTSLDGSTWVNRSSLVTINVGISTSLKGIEYCPTEKCFVIVTGDAYINTVKLEKSQYSVWSATNVSIATNPKNYNFIYYSHIHDLLILVGSNSAFVSTNIIYYAFKNLNTSYISSWYEYFFKEYDSLTEVIFQDIPVYSSNKTTIGIYDYNNIKVGVSIVGFLSKLGVTQYGGSAGIIDYSKKETDEFGTTFFTKRAFSKRMNVNLLLSNGDLTRVQNLLADIRATPCVWIGTDSSIYSPLVMYGFYRDFNIEIIYPEYSYCSLQIEGLT